MFKLSPFRCIYIRRQLQWRKEKKKVKSNISFNIFEIDMIININPVAIEQDFNFFLKLNFFVRFNIFIILYFWKACLDAAIWNRERKQQNVFSFFYLVKFELQVSGTQQKVWALIVQRYLVLFCFFSLIIRL